MNIFVAGGSGTIGVPLVRALVARGHRVTATTRSPEKTSLISALGATPVVVDALDAHALEGAVQSAAPTHVIHQLTALPKVGARRASDLEPTNRLRNEGTRNLLGAAIAAGAERIIVGSFAMLGTAQDSTRVVRDPAAAAVKSMESQVLEAAARGLIEGIVLRYGLFYGPSNPATQELLALVRRRRLPRIRHDRGQLPFIHIDDAVSATLAALDRGSSGRVYNVVDDEPTSFSNAISEMAAMTGSPRPFAVPWRLVRILAPYMSRLFTVRFSETNTEARRELAWALQFPRLGDGLRHMIAQTSEGIYAAHASHAQAGGNDRTTVA